MRFKKVVFIVFTLAIMLIPINIVAAETIIYNDNLTVSIQIDDAYYYSADNDDIENDIATHFTITVTKRCNNHKKMVNFYLLVGLTLPSGTYYEYLFLVTSPCVCTASPTAYFYNHASESGWYLVELTGILMSGDPAQAIGTEAYCFDPPGGTDGTDPLVCSIIV